MHFSSYTMTEQITYDRETVLLGMGLHRMHHIADPVSDQSFFDTKV